MAAIMEEFGIGGFDPDHPNGNVIVRVVDHGDGTGTRSRYDADGVEVETEQIDCPIPALVEGTDPLADVDPATIRAAVAAGALLVSRAGDLWDALVEIADTNTAKTAIEIVTDVALQAALGEGAP